MLVMRGMLRMFNRTYLECRNPDIDKFRFYAIYITKTVFGDWAIIREWGRIGSPGTIREDWFDNEHQAISKANSIVRNRVRRGYCLLR